MKLRQKVVELINSIYDLRNFLKYSFEVGDFRDKNHYMAYLTKQYHTIEKGLALPNVKLGFGEDKILDLINITSKYVLIYGEDALTENIICVLRNYIDFHIEKNYQSKLINEITGFVKNKRENKSTGGVKLFQKSNLNSEEYELFVKSRVSVRNFKDILVPQKEILKAIEIAKFTPSVCNRQGWKLHIYNGNDASALLALQNGNKGFGEYIKTIGIITGDIRYFSNNERNQIGIDSGMFSMSLISAFHSMGIATCALNTCVSVRSEERIKRAAKIPNYEKVIMFLAIGYPKDNCVVAKSLRRENESFVTFH